jgi:3-methyladenine DNA glycosylase AlkD
MTTRSKPVKPGILLRELRRALAKAGDKQRAVQMQAYMKSAMPYHGVPAPVCYRTFREVFSDLAFSSFSNWRDTVLHFWRKAKFREERYAAIMLCQSRCSRAFQTPEALDVYEEMVVAGAWWDFVDAIAHLAGELLRHYPKEIAREMKAWSRCDNMWKRRVSILCQLKFKGDTDLKLLYGCIEPSIPLKEFFLRKAIGWALRQYAWTDPEEVKRYVRANASRLSPLSQREALKNV